MNPPVPQEWHPEDLYNHVIDLEKLLDAIVQSTTRERAVAKAIASAAGSFLEGALTELMLTVFAQHAAQFGKQAKDCTQKLRSTRPGLGRKLTCFQNVLLNTLNPGTSPIPTPSALYVARNAVDHGNLIPTASLHLDNPKFFRTEAYNYLVAAYHAVHRQPPTWMVAP